MTILLPLEFAAGNFEDLHSQLSELHSQGVFPIIRLVTNHDFDSGKWLPGNPEMYRQAGENIAKALDAVVFPQPVIIIPANEPNIKRENFQTNPKNLYLAIDNLRTGLGDNPPAIITFPSLAEMTGPEDMSPDDFVFHFKAIADEESRAGKKQMVFGIIDEHLYTARPDELTQARNRQFYRVFRILGPNFFPETPGEIVSEFGTIINGSAIVQNCGDSRYLQAVWEMAAVMDQFPVQFYLAACFTPHGRDVAVTPLIFADNRVYPLR